MTQRSTAYQAKHSEEKHRVIGAFFSGPAHQLHRAPSQKSGAASLQFGSICWPPETPLIDFVHWAFKATGLLGGRRDGGTGSRMHAPEGHVTDPSYMLAATLLIDYRLSQQANIFPTFLLGFLFLPSHRIPSHVYPPLLTCLPHRITIPPPMPTPPATTSPVSPRRKRSRTTLRLVRFSAVSQLYIAADVLTILTGTEQKRRQAIREGFDRLTELVPGLEGQGRSEGLVLKRTVDYMRQQLDERKNMIEQIEQSGAQVDPKMKE